MALGFQFVCEIHKNNLYTHTNNNTDDNYHHDDNNNYTERERKTTTLFSLSLFIAQKTTF